MLMCDPQRLQDLGSNRQHARPRQPAGRVVQAIADRLALEVLEREQELPVGLGAMQTPNDEWAIELRQDVHLFDELLPTALAGRKLGVQDLERDATLRQVLLGLEDLPHAPGAERAMDDVVADALDWNCHADTLGGGGSPCKGRAWRGRTRAAGACVAAS
jgi:hypothetical protein